MFPTPVDLTGKTHVKADIRTLGTGTSQDISLQIGPAFEWCQGNFTFVQPNTTATTDVDLVSAFSCDISTRPMNDVRGMYVFFSGNGTFYLDNVRARSPVRAERRGVDPALYRLDPAMRTSGPGCQASGRLVRSRVPVA